MIARTGDPQTASVSGFGRAGGVLRGMACCAALTVLLIAATLSLSVALLPAVGYQTTVLYGQSMEPTIHSGALVITRAVSPASLQVGDVITYRRPEAQASVTHRIVAERVVDGKRAFTMKGDRNPTPDPNGISFSADTQKMVLNLPYAGYAISLLHSPRGMLLVTALPAIGLAMLFVLGMGKPNEEEAPARA